MNMANVNDFIQIPAYADLATQIDQALYAQPPLGSFKVRSQLKNLRYILQLHRKPNDNGNAAAAYAAGILFALNNPRIVK